MSGVTNIRAAIETALAAISPTLTPAYENVAFTPTAGTPYQRVEWMWARPGNNEISQNYTQEGICQVTLCYPTNTGPAAAAARAEVTKATFKRGSGPYTSSGVSVSIPYTPEVMPAYVDGDRYCVPVRIRVFAQLTA